MTTDDYEMTTTLTFGGTAELKMFTSGWWRRRHHWHVDVYDDGHELIACSTAVTGYRDREECWSDGDATMRRLIDECANEIAVASVEDQVAAMDDGLAMLVGEMKAPASGPCAERLTEMIDTYGLRGVERTLADIAADMRAGERR